MSVHDRSNVPRGTASVVALVASLAIGIAASGGVNGAEPAAEDSPAPVLGGTARVSDAELRQFVAAAARVKAIREEYVLNLQSLQQETEARMVSSVQQAGMTIGEFRTIFESVQVDPELARRLESLQSQ